MLAQTAMFNGCDSRKLKWNTILFLSCRINHSVIVLSFTVIEYKDFPEVRKCFELYKLDFTVSLHPGSV